ncbi:mannose-ethanolamine phosphotransferase gpi13 [Saxophila tyrrhenica]|uniref:Mannose-ethanolamine phosphotransferase gpi13 n=1 Tax=Saxophila tyrrhenica TaxID=1690608 RepID=A0AAV9PK92_9PEZI|nr:mannose-ethanolamine phosphotransferase gpi13 [Saxophila tyrrhenica]
MANDGGISRSGASSEERADNEKQLSVQFKAQHAIVVAFFLLILTLNALALYLFCSGFLLSRLVLPNRSQCALPPVELLNGHTPGSHDRGCWHPKTFDKAVIILVDALRYDFTVPFQPQPGDEQPHHFHNALPVLYETAVQSPGNAFLRPFIADPPTTTLQRLKGLTTGSLPTLIDAGSNFAGTAIDEDNLIEQLYLAGKKVVHLGDDTWHSLFPGYFEPNLTRPYDSFNVWDLHTLDNGVNEHMFPLLEPEMAGRWDVLIGHYLGVDHAGHRYGPDHPAMTDKLQQMDRVFRSMIERLDDSTLLVVMGDHGMDAKGDHGGESDDEVEAALWMYSKKGVFGRSDPAFAEPPATAKVRPVGQIDLVPTLALLLGIPIPFNNLGQPIEEAFIGKKGADYKNMAEVSRLTAHQIHGYQGEYAKARNLDESATSSTQQLWRMAGQTWDEAVQSRNSADGAWKKAYQVYKAYEDENLRLCKNLWARFDLNSMMMGIIALVGTFAVIVMYAQSIQGDRAGLTPALLLHGLVGMSCGVVGAMLGKGGAGNTMQLAAFGAVAGPVVTMSIAFFRAREGLRVPYPRTFWGGLCFLSTLLLCIGFAANSFTIWEDEILLFLLTTFGVAMLASSLGQADSTDRNFGAANSLSFLAATRLSSLSRLCREEQMPYCVSTYYASALSSTSAGWQTLIPFVVALALPSILRYHYVRTKNFQGSAVIWIALALRIALVLTAAFWVLNAADDGDWYPSIPKATLKSSRTVLAQIVLAIAAAAGYSTYIWSPPLLLVRTEEPSSSSTPSTTSTSKPITPNHPTGGAILTTINPTPSTPRPKLLILGYANTHGTRYLLLPLIYLPALLLVQKPMGQGALALCTISILNVLEVLDACNLRRSPLGPVLLGIMGCFYFFKTGHQAALSTIQWETAFIPLKTIRYPWSPILITLNTFGPQILCAIAVPAVAMWKVPPKSPGLLGRIAGAMATHLLFYAAITVATVVEAAWLRRHLMLYRVFMPRMLMAGVVVLVVEVIGAVVAVGGVRWSVQSVAGVFGWAEG